MIWPILIWSLTEQGYMRIWCSTWFVKQMRTLGKSRHSLRQGDKTQGWEPFLQTVGRKQRWSVLQTLQQKTNSQKKQLNIRTCCTGQCKSSEWPTWENAQNQHNTLSSASSTWRQKCFSAMELCPFSPKLLFWKLSHFVLSAWKLWVAAI